MSVIKEVPVYLSKSYMENLLLFEFPSRPKQNAIKDSQVVECKYKPKFHHAELSLALDTKSPNYERHRGQDLARLAPDQFPGGAYDRQLLRSQPCTEPSVAAAGPQQQQRPQRCCAVARFHAGRLLLCPMPPGGRLVMQPALDHLDVKQADSSAGAAAAPDPSEVEARAVTLRFARQETPEARQRREQSHRACQRLLDQEPWLRCRWLGGDWEVDDLLVSGAASVAQSVAMETQQDEEEPGEAPMDVEEDYLGRLCPPVSAVSAVGDSAPSGIVDRAPTVSLARLRAMPCEERLRALLKSACVLRWTQLVDLLKQCGMTHGQLAESLAQIQGHLTDLACLVHGLWVVKSEVLFPAGTVSMHSGVPAEVMCRGRDYILCRFVQGRTVTRKEVASLVKMPSEEISQILSRISRVVRHGGGGPGGGAGDPGSPRLARAPKMRLAFVTEEDTEYVKRNPEVVRKAQYYWEAKWKLLSDQLKLDKASRAYRTTSISADSVGGGGGSRRSRTRSARYSTSSSDCGAGGTGGFGGGGGGADTASDSSLSAASSHAAADQKQKRRRRLYSRRQCVSMCESDAGAPTTVPIAASASAGASDIAPDPDNSDLDRRLRCFLLAKLQDRLVAGLDELARFFRAESGVEAAPSLPTGEEACRRVFDAAAESLGLFVLTGGGSSRLYAFASDSQPHAAHRRQLLAALQAGAGQVTLGQARARFESAGLEPLTEAALKFLVRDYCQFRGKAYFAKGYQHAS